MFKKIKNFYSNQLYIYNGFGASGFDRRLRPPASIEYKSMFR
jgi:hypothetical protein